MTGSDPTSPIQDCESRVEDELAEVTADLALALGLIRVLTLLVLHDPALNEIERRLARGLEGIGEARRLISESAHIVGGPERRDS